MPREKLVHDGLQDCPYLPGRVARMPLYRQLERLSQVETDARLARSERRVGWAMYRTECPGCDECKGLRVLVDEFKPSRSQRRVRRRWEGLVRVEYSSPTWSPEKLEIFNRHKQQRDLVDTPDKTMGALGYVSWLVQSCVETLELRYFLDDRLVGVSILDMGRESASSVYYYFDPDPEISKLSPGVFSALNEIELCRRTKRRYYYLGLYVRDCVHMNYKADYRPYELYLDEEWVRFDTRTPEYR